MENSGFKAVAIEKTDNLIPYTRNAKKHGKAQINNVAKSISEFGMVQPIVVDNDNNVIIGHCRLLACKKLGMTEVPIVKIDNLTPEEANKLRLLDNKLNESEWDFDLLAEDIPELDFDGYDIDWNLPEIAEPIETHEDEAPDEVEPKAKPGDIWVLGNHRLMCGDSTVIGNIDKLTDGVKIHMLFTDPPYGMDLDTDFSSMKSKLGAMRGGKYAQGNVDEFHPEMIDTCLAIDAEECFLFGADYFAELLPDKNKGSWIVWDKRASMDGDDAKDASADKMYGSCFELAWSKKKHKRDIARVKWAGLFGMQDEFDKKRWHPTQKPIKLVAWFLERYSDAHDTVLDLFGGSGSTMMACEQLGRICYMMELDPHYCDVIVQRWENLTKKKAVKI